jgi:hypothetical protein
MVSVLANGFKVCRFKPVRGNGFLTVIKIHSTPSFGGALNLRPHVVRFYGMLKKSTKYERDIS